MAATTSLPEALSDLHVLCREGRVFGVQQWVRDGKPLQLHPRVEISPRRQWRSALHVALETGQHSLCELLLRAGVQPEIERTSPVNLALRARRWDLVDLLFEYGADPKQVDIDCILDTYCKDIYERFYCEGVDVTEGHALAHHLAEHTSNKPLFGFAKRHARQDARIQTELDIALAHHTWEGRQKGILLCLWAGADPHARVRDLDYGSDDDPEDERLSAVEAAAERGNVSAIRRFKPDPMKVDFQRLYELARSREVVETLADAERPRRIASIFMHQSFWANRDFSDGRDWEGVLAAVLQSGERWESADKEQLQAIRLNLLRASDFRLKPILSDLMRSECCAPEVFAELSRTPAMKKRLIQMKLAKPYVRPIGKAKKRQQEVDRLLLRYERERLYAEVWRRPVSHVAKAYGVSGSYLARVCRLLRVPTPGRGYWSRLRHGKPVSRRPLRPLPRTASG